jgi:hypothetical protein
VDTCEGWGLLVAKNGDLHGHQRVLQLARTGDFFMATDTCFSRAESILPVNPVDSGPVSITRL